MKPIVAFTGPMGSGKSTAAEAVVKEFGYRKMSFAEPLRDMLRCIGLEGSDFSTAGKNKPIDWLGGKTARQILQTLGTEWGRNHVCEDLWIRVWKRSAERVIGELGYPGIVVDDCRFDNEADAVHAMGGVVLSIWLDDGYSKPAHQPAHPSEAGISTSKIDASILNCKYLGVDKYTKFVTDYVKEIWLRKQNSNAALSQTVGHPEAHAMCY